jgi:flagellin-like hook-associated protein FlgL
MEHANGRSVLKEAEEDRMEKLVLTLEITERTVLEYLQQFPEGSRCEKALDALKVGVIAIQSASPSLDTRVVEEKFRQVEEDINGAISDFKEEIRTKLEQYFKAEGGFVPLCLERYFGENGSLARAMEEYFDMERGRLSEVLKRQVGPESFLGRQMDPANREGLIARVESVVEEIIKENSRQVLGAFSLDDENSSLSRLKRSIREELERFDKKASEQYASILALLEREKGRMEEAQRGTAKGRDFEDALYERLARLARELGDWSENVSGSKGSVAYEKVGDYVVRLGEDSAASGKVLVFEAKKASGYNLRKIKDELDRAKKNREADMGIFVFCKGYEPPEVGDFYRMGGDFVVTVDEDALMGDKPVIFFETAYRIARAMIATRVREEEKKAIDEGYIRSEMENIIKALERASDILTKVGTIRNSADAIEKNVDKLQESIRRHVENIQSHLPH